MQVIAFANIDNLGQHSYLQENGNSPLRMELTISVVDDRATGFGEAAVKLEQKWNNDPRKLPFANNVGRKALQHLVQKGLEFNAIQKQLRNVSYRRLTFWTSNLRPFPARVGGTCISLDAVLWHARRPSTLSLATHQKAIGDASSILTRTAQAWTQ